MKIERYIPMVGDVVYLTGVTSITPDEYNHSEHCQVDLWQNGDELKVLMVTDRVAVCWNERDKTASGVVFEKLTPDSPKNLAIVAMTQRSVMGQYWMMTVQANAVYDAIASGKIPGVYIVERSK